MTLPASARSYAIPLPDGITGELRWVGGPMTKRAIAHLRKWIDFYEETISEPDEATADAASRSADASTSVGARGMTALDESSDA